MRFGIPELDRLASEVEPRVALVYGEAGSGRTTLALRACARAAEGGQKALYMCRGAPVIGEEALEDDVLVRLMIGSFMSPEEVPEYICQVRPSLTAVDPINGGSCEEMRGSARITSSALCGISMALAATASELILVGDVINSGDGLKARHFDEIVRYCDLVVEMRKNPDNEFAEAEVEDLARAGMRTGTYIGTRGGEKTKRERAWEVVELRVGARSRCPFLALKSAP